jgi:hypothetical protein
MRRRLDIVCGSLSPQWLKSRFTHFIVAPSPIADESTTSCRFVFNPSQ